MGVKAPALPTDTPPFTLGDLKRAIPAHCFERDTLKSLYYVAHDLFFAAVLYAASQYIDSPALPAWAPYLLWPLYWWCQGIVLTGVWVIAHECGHRAFSPNEALGDFVGLVLHTCLLVPYHPWRISHRKHHSRTNHMTEDEVFIPETRSEAGDTEAWEDMPAIVSLALRVSQIGRMLLFGWPVYLLTHVTGRKYGSRTNHFEPSAPLFADSERRMVVLSDIALALWMGALGYAGATVGWMWLAKVYIVPYLWVNLWLVLITHLQHTDQRLPHYRSKEWTWLKGALCTMDRDYGYLNYWHHHIADTHVTHHIFSYMPHYHAEEATRALRPLLGKYYLEDTVRPGLAGIAQALWNSFTHCRFVEDEGEVLWFKSR